MKLLFVPVIILFFVGYLGYTDGIKPNTQTADLSIRFKHFKPIIEYPHLLAHWALDEGSGYEFLDWSGNGLTAYITGHDWNTHDSGLTSSFRKNGKRGGCVFLNGRQWLQVKHTPELNLSQDFTISFWINPKKSSKSVLINKSQDNEGFLISNNNDASLSFTYYDQSGEPYTFRSKEEVVEYGVWQKLAFTYEQVNSRLTFFLNDKKISEFNLGGNDMANSISDLYIGGSPNVTQGFVGSIDEISIFYSAIDSDEISSLYISGMPKIYIQSRETIDDNLSEWSLFRGNSPIPHPLDKYSILNLRFDGNTISVKGDEPVYVEEAGFVPGVFGGALDASDLTRGLSYCPPLEKERGTFESWVLLPENKVESPLFKISGEESSVELFLSNDIIRVFFAKSTVFFDSLVLSELFLPYEQLLHIALSWDVHADYQKFTLYINGAQVSVHNTEKMVLDHTVWIGGNGAENFKGLIDDVSISNIPKQWGEICPRGNWDTESSSLDLMLNFNNNRIEPLFHWMSNSINNTWKYYKKPWDKPEEAYCIIQLSIEGFHTLYHPDAYGHNSSFEVSVSMDSLQSGWTGVFVQSPDPSQKKFTGHSFAVNMGTNQIRIATFYKGKIIQEKTLENDFQFKPRRVYSLTLSAIDGLLRGYIDNRNTISLVDKQKLPRKGFAGLMTIDASAHFDDVHFRPITPPVKKSRKIELRMLAETDQVSVSSWSLNAFRWQKRHGLVPWKRTFKNPEPPGNIFGPDEKTLRPNPSSDWRSQDAANSAVILVNGKFYYFMRGNPSIDGRHGNARLGVLWATDKEFDGIRFNDPTWREDDNEENWILTGNPDTNKEGCSDEPPRGKYFQLNDQGVVFIDGKIIVVCREFRNSNEHSRQFRRLVMGLFDTKKKVWLNEQPITMDWSKMNPDSCYAAFKGLNATPEVTLIRDPETDKFVVLLYHFMTREHRIENEISSDMRYTAVSGFQFDGSKLIPYEAYPENRVISKKWEDLIFGERILFDNGIWFMHINAHRDKLERDWPDRFELYASLDPYLGPWLESSENDNHQRVYFERGLEFDPDNGAIWQGSMLKYRNRYYMYYENYHVIDDVEHMYEKYDHPQTGSRVGFAVAN